MTRRTPFLRPAAWSAALTLFVLVGCSELGEQPVVAPDAPLDSETARDPGPQDFGPAIRAAERYTPALLRNPAVVGTGVGLNDAGRPTVRLFLAHGQARGLPDRLDDVPVSRVVTGPFVLRQDRTARARPAPIGFSVGHPDITAGTLGARVTDGTNVFILSNNHILANSNNASLGDDALQPGPFDGGSSPGDVIGILHDFEEISFSSNNRIDAAIALVDPADVSGSTPDGAGYGAPAAQVQTATIGMGVQKYGRTTGHTFGTVEETNVTVSICFVTRGPFQCAQSATFVDQISISDGSFSDGGDSGSLIVTASDNRPVGLLFAGSSTRTIANPIGPVLERFGVTIDSTVPDGGGDGGDGGDGGNGGDDPAPITLTADAYKVRGLQKVDLAWSGAGSSQVDIFRNGSLLATVDNSGAYHDAIDQRGGASYTYRVCEAGTTTCSDEVTATF